MSLKVFLSGAIENCEDNGSIWRDEAEYLLKMRGYDVANPVKIICSKESSPQEVVEKNLFMQKRSDILLVEYNIPNRCYIGTDFELTYAKFNNQPAIVFCNNENKNRVYLNFLATKIAPTLEDAVEYICSNYPTN